MLHSIDHQGNLVSVSDQRGQYLEHNQPLFFRNGWLRDIPYQFVRKDGAIIDVLLSAIAERDVEGRIKRSLAVVVDITQRKRAEEQLSLYSKDLERQVAERTCEVMSFLAYTPAVVYMKDQAGRYLLVNSCFEAVLGTSLDEVRGRRYEEQALQSGGFRQFEELIGQDGYPLPTCR